MARKTTSATPATAVAVAPAPGTDATPHFDQVRLHVAAAFATITTKSPALFTTDVDPDALWEAYLSGFTDPAERQGHNCTACRKFIQQYGGLVVINEDGDTMPAFWIPGPTPYVPSIAAMEYLVTRAKVTGPFLTSAEVWGQIETGQWRHFAAVAPAFARTWANSTLSAGPAIAEKKQDHLNVLTALDEFPMSVVAPAVVVLKSETLYRSEKCLAQAEWLLSLHAIRATTKGRRCDNLLWRAITSAPAGFCHPRSSMIGTLLEDIVAALPHAEVSRRFAEKMNPLQYQRPTAAPSAGNIEQAERIVAKMGITASLRRRYLRMDEVQALWRPAPPVATPPATGVFGHLRAAAAAPAVVLPPVTMTWVKFAANVLPGAAKMELEISAVPNNFSALVTAADPDAPPIIQWDSADERNPVSWYLYQGGTRPDSWGLQIGRVPVAAVCLQPSLWGDDEHSHLHQGVSVFLLLENMWDRRYKRCGLGLFPEILKTELHAIRPTIEAHSRTGVIEGAETPAACGIRLQAGTHWGGVAVGVTDAVGNVATYKLDRWD